MTIDDINLRAAPFLKADHFPEAAKIYREALDASPNDPQLMNNLAGILNKCGDWDVSLALCGELISKHPHVYEGFNQIGTAHWCKHDFGRAMAAFNAAVELAPDFHMPKHNMGTLALMHRMWDQGWWGHEFRFSAKGRKLRYKSELLWDGVTPQPQLTIWGEQGVGDEVLQLSYADSLLDAQPHGDIFWQCDPRLVDLFSRAYPQIEFQPRNDRTYGELHGQHFPASSLGRLYRSTDEDFPTERMNYLDAKPMARGVAHKRIGISWHSAKAQYAQWKSSPLAAWAPLLGLDAEFYSLQYTPYAQGNELDRFPQVNIQRPLDTTDDLNGLANLIASCDLVVTVSNTTAHLAAALGVPTIVLLPNRAILPWCWGITEHTLWYPTVKVLRMAHDEGWDALLQRTALEVGSRL